MKMGEPEGSLSGQQSFSANGRRRARRVVALVIGACLAAYDASAEPAPDPPPSTTGLATGLTSAAEPLKSLHISCTEQMVPSGPRTADCEFIQVRIRPPQPPPTPSAAAQSLAETRKRLTPAIFASVCADIGQKQGVPLAWLQSAKSACAAHDVSAYANALEDFWTNHDSNTCTQTAVSLHRSFKRVSADTWTSVDALFGVTEVWTLSKQGAFWIAHVATTQSGSQDQPPSTVTEDYAFPVVPVELPCKYLH
jgi:hypothetical protein